MPADPNPPSGPPPDPVRPASSRPGSSHRTPGGSSSWRALPRPDRIARFEVREVLGGGAFGVVYRAYDPQLEREVAIKVPRPGTLTTPKRVERFLGDAKAAAQLRHPHIVPVFDCGTDGDLIYIAAAYVRGQTLAEAVDAGPFDPRRAAGVVAKLAEALAYAHASGIVHRDVKPSNVVLDEHDEPHLIDFGLAQRGGGAERGRMILGTPAYMSPEQAAGESADARPAFDQYALGVTLYELLTGRTPFSGPSKIQLFHAVNTQPPPPREVNPGVPLDLHLICLKALAKHPDNRYPGCAALAADLRRYLAGEVPSVRTLTRRERLARWVKTEPTLAAAVGVAGLLVVVLAVLGTAFGVVQARNNRALTAANRTAEDARTAAVENEGKAVAARVLADENARHALSELAGATFDRAVVVGEQGEIGRCLTDLASALALAVKAENHDLAAVVRQNLAGWRREAHRLAAVHALPFAPAAFAPGPGTDSVLLVGATAPAGSHATTYDLISGTAGARVATPALPARAAATDPDRKRLLTIGDDGVARVFDAATGAAAGEARPATGAKFVCGAVFPGGERLLLGDSKGSVTTYRRTPDGWEAGPPVQHSLGLDDLLDPFQVRAVAVHPSGPWVLTAGGSRLAGQIVLRDAATLAPIYMLPGRDEKLLPVTTAAFSPGNGNVFVTGHGTLLAGEARAWKTATGAALPGGIMRHQAEVNAVAFSPGGRFAATASQDRSARVFDAETWAPVGQPLWHEKDVRAVVFNADGRRLVTGGDENALRVWNIAPGPAAVYPLRVPDALLATAADPPNNRLFAGGLRQGRVWHTTTREAVPGEWTPPTTPVLAAAYSPNGARLALGSARLDARTGAAVVLDRAGKQVASFDHPSPVLSVAFSPDNQLLATGCADGIARVWNLAAPDKPAVELAHVNPGRVYAVRFTPDGRYLFTGGTDGRGLLWNPAIGKVAHAMPHPDAVLSVAFSDTGRRIVTGYVGAALVWDWTPGESPRQNGPLLPHGPAGVFAVDVSPDGATALTGGTDGTARLWDLKTRKPLGPVWRPGSAVKAVGFWPGDRFVAAGTDLYAGRVMVIGKPPRIEEDPGRVALWVEVCTGIGSRLAVLDPVEWDAKRKQLARIGEPKIEAMIRAEQGVPRPRWDDGSREPWEGSPAGPPKRPLVEVAAKPTPPDKSTTDPAKPTPPDNSVIQVLPPPGAFSAQLAGIGPDFDTLAVIKLKRA